MSAGTTTRVDATRADGEAAPASSASAQAYAAAYHQAAEDFHKRKAEEDKRDRDIARKKIKMGESPVMVGKGRVLEEKEGVTGVEAPHLKSVKRTNLQMPDQHSQPPLEERLRVKRERERDFLYFLTTCGPEYTHVVQEYAELAQKYLESCDMSPVDARFVDPEDIAIVQPAVIEATQSRHLTSLRVHIWTTLRICVKYSQVFCPPPDPDVSRPILVNPEVLTNFITDDEGPLAVAVSWLVGTPMLPEMFVAVVLANYQMECPWEGADDWQSRDNNGKTIRTLSIADMTGPNRPSLIPMLPAARVAPAVAALPAPGSDHIDEGVDDDDDDGNNNNNDTGS